jgi:hypothetical protein
MITVQRNDYNSSTVKSSSYNYKHLTLEVYFSHATYVYSGVSEKDYINFSIAESQGKALNSFIKDKYDFQKLHETKKIVNI